MAAFKLAALLLKQLTKPVAKRIEGKMENNAWFKAHCIQFAQAMNRVSVRITRNITGDAKEGTRVLPLSESRAVNYGASLISEGVIFSVAGGLILYEYGRKGRADDLKKAQEEDRRQGVETALAELREDIELLRLSLSRQGIAVKGEVHGKTSQELPDDIAVTAIGSWWHWASGAKQKEQLDELARRREERCANKLLLQAEAEEHAKKYADAVAKRIAQQQQKIRNDAQVKAIEHELKTGIKAPPVAPSAHTNIGSLSDAATQELEHELIRSVPGGAAATVASAPPVTATPAVMSEQSCESETIEQASVTPAPPPAVTAAAAVPAAFAPDDESTNRSDNRLAVGLALVGLISWTASSCWRSNR